MVVWKDLSTRWVGRLRGHGQETDRGDATSAHENTLSDDAFSTTEFLVRRHARCRANALAARIVETVEQAPGIRLDEIAQRLHETSVVVITEVDRLVDEGRLRLDRDTGAFHPLLDARITPASPHQERADDPTPVVDDVELDAAGARRGGGRVLLVMLLLRLYRRFREVPGARIEATTRGLQLIVGQSRILDATLPQDGDYIWLDIDNEGHQTGRERIRDTAVLLRRIQALSIPATGE